MARRRAGLSQRGVARRAEIPQPNVSRIERGLVSPSVDTVARLLRACGMSLEATPRVDDGVDRAQLRELLAATPGARVRLAAAATRSVVRMREADRRAR
jgi:transcriptional regulator with XRE-family HTH domain